MSYKGRNSGWNKGLKRSKASTQVGESTHSIGNDDNDTPKNENADE